ncbi:MAG: GIY-YIG nuclease family protein [Acidobacteriota bacterium]
MNESVDRRSAKRHYKESHRPMGVFQVRNTVNGKVFIDSSPNLPAIFNRIRMQLKTGSYLKHPELQKDWNEHGSDAFEFEVLEELEPSDAPGWDSADDLAALLEIICEQRQPYGDAGYNR